MKPFLTGELFTYAWVLAISFWGGFAGYIRKINKSDNLTFSILALFGDLVISGFSGLMTYFLCQGAELDAPITAVLVGISGHMGSQAIFVMEEVFHKPLHLFISKWTDKDHTKND